MNGGTGITTTRRCRKWRSLAVVIHLPRQQCGIKRSDWNRRDLARAARTPPTSASTAARDWARTFLSTAPKRGAARTAHSSRKSHQVRTRFRNSLSRQAATQRSLAIFQVSSTSPSRPAVMISMAKPTFPHQRRAKRKYRSQSDPRSR